jgi:hypothetical protein
MVRSVAMLALLAPTDAYTCAVRPAVAHRRAHRDATMGSFEDMLAKTKQRDEERAKAPPPEPVAAGESQSLAAQMFGTVSNLFDRDDEADEDAAAPAAPSAEAGADALVADIDARAQTGELTFTDFLTMSEAFAGLGDQQLPGMPTLTPAQMAETREKFEKHAKICEVMLDDERAAPSMLIDDLKAGGAKPGPRIQRLAVASGQPETEVGLFLMQFEAMRESTRRIAAGEDPDEVNTSMAAPPGANRQARRNAKKNAAKAMKKEKK